MNKREHFRYYGILIRYLVLILVGLPNLWIFYAVFTPLTVYPSLWISKLFFDVALISRTTLLVNGQIPIDLIKSCIAGAAYYLILILSLSVPGIKIKKRLLMIGTSFLSLLVLNIIRIVLLVWIYVSYNAAFDLTHEIFWYALSTIFVIGIWFAEVKIFKIKEIPFYSDIIFLFKRTIRTK